MPFIDVGVVRVADDCDMKHFLSICDNHDGWSVEVTKPDLQVWSKPTPQTDFRIIKVSHTTIMNVSALMPTPCFS